MGRPTSSRRLIAEASDLLEQWTGFTLRQTTPRRISEAFSNRARQLGYDDPNAYLDALRDLEPTAGEPQRLINLITNGLTAFWRDEPQLSALRSLLNHLSAGTNNDQPVHVWCAGVSTGEEAYTAAMIAAEESVPVEVLGTDVNTEFIDTARRGIYSGWSLRRLDARRRNRFLHRIDANHWSIQQPLLEDVRFARHNLLETPPASNHPDGRWDIVMCRNVLIYFSPDATAQALQQLTSGLNQSGYLMFGSSEQIHPERFGADVPRLRPIRQGGGFVYRPGLRRTGETIEPGSWSLDDDDNDSPPGPPASFDAAESAGLRETTSDVCETDTVADLLDTASDHIEQDDYELALACLEAALGYDPFHVECHCVMGAVLYSLGASESALEAFQKALFLEPTHWFAAHRSAMIYETRGDANSARRQHHRVVDGLDSDDDPVDQSALLRQMIGSVERIRQLAKNSADEFFHLHGADTSG